MLTASNTGRERQKTWSYVCSGSKVTVSLPWEQREPLLSMHCSVYCMLELPNMLEYQRIFLHPFSFSDVPFFFFPNRCLTATNVRKETPVEDYVSSAFLRIQSQQLWPSIPQEAFFGKGIVFLGQITPYVEKNGLKY